MSQNIIHHYPPELLQLLVDTIPLLCRGKEDVLIFFKGAGVATNVFSDFQEIVARDRKSINKFRMVREILVRLNEKGEVSLRERREILKRVTEFEDFSTCWANDQLKAKGLVAEIRRVVDVKDSFGRMRQEQEAERMKRAEDQKQKITAENDRKAKLDSLRRELFALFSMKDAHKRGKLLETVLNSMFQIAQIKLRDSFTRVGTGGEGVVEQIDGAIELDGHIYLVEMKWWSAPLGPGDVAPHLVRLYSREGARGIIISYSGFTPAALAACTEALIQRVVCLCELQEVVILLERNGDLAGFFRNKIRAAVLDKKALFKEC